ncbi:unnamed protein product, partial [Mesorhabditis spiculigera]
MAGVRAVVFLSLAGVLGLTLLVLGCALPMFGNWWPMFVISFYIVVPLPLMIAKHFQEDMDGTSACIELALFITTGIVVSAFALPTVLAHCGAIKAGSCVLTEIANVVMFGTICAIYFLGQYKIHGTVVVLVWMANTIFFGAIFSYFRTFNREEMHELALW